MKSFLGPVRTENINLTSEDFKTEIGGNEDQPIVTQSFCCTNMNNEKNTQTKCLQ